MLHEYKEGAIMLSAKGLSSAKKVAFVYLLDLL